MHFHQAYTEQSSGTCMSQLPTPPTTSHTSSGGADFAHLDYFRLWADGISLSDLLPSFVTGGRPTYPTKEAYCAGAYAGQMSLACVCNSDNPVPGFPTTFPVLFPTTNRPARSPTTGPTQVSMPGPTRAPTPGPTQAPTPGPAQEPTSSPTQAPTPGPT